MKHLSRKNHWPYVKIGCLDHFYVLYHIILLRRFIHLYGLFQKKRNRVVEDIERNIKWIFRGLIKNNVEFQGWSRKIHVEYPGVLVLGLKIYVGCNTICGISRGETLFCFEFQEVALLFFFFWNSPLWYRLNRREHPCMGGKTPPLLPHSQYIYCKNLYYRRRGKPPALQYFKNCFKVKLKSRFC